MLLLTAISTSGQNSFIDLKTLESLTGASLCVGLVCNAAQVVFNFNPKWLALAIAIVFSYCLVFFTSTASGVNLLLAFFNGLLIWSTATGANAITSPASNSNKEGAGSSGFTGHIGRNRKFLDRWF